MIPDRQLAAVAALDRRVRRFPPDASCATATCQAWSALVLTTTTSPTLCYRCRLDRDHLPFDREHHIGGQGSPLVAEVTPNLHRACSWFQIVTWQALGIAPASDLAISIDYGALAVLRELVG